MPAGERRRVPPRARGKAHDPYRSETGDDTETSGGGDQVYGGLGNDTLIGSAGTDWPAGGGRDRFYGGGLDYRHNSVFTAAGQVRINDIAGADVLVEVNTGGTLAADFAIRLTNTLLGNMSGGDFVL